MNQILDQHEETEIIESIVSTFSADALEDVRNNRRNCCAAGILVLRILDDFSGFLFIGDERERIVQFVSTYLLDYDGLALYDTLKRSFYHNYVIPMDAGASSGGVDGNVGSVGTEEKLPMEKLIEDLEGAFTAAFKDLRNDPGKRQLALEWFQTHAVYLWPETIYSQKLQDKLSDYYIPLLRRYPFFARDRYSIELHFSPQKEKNYLITVMIWTPGKDDTIRIPLDLVIDWMGLREVAEVIEELEEE